MEFIVTGTVFVTVEYRTIHSGRHTNGEKETLFHVLEHILCVCQSHVECFPTSCDDPMGLEMGNQITVRLTNLPT